MSVVGAYKAKGNHTEQMLEHSGRSRANIHVRLRCPAPLPATPILVEYFGCKPFVLGYWQVPSVLLRLPGLIGQILYMYGLTLKRSNLGYGFRGCDPSLASCYNEPHCKSTNTWHAHDVFLYSLQADTQHIRDLKRNAPHTKAC